MNSVWINSFNRILTENMSAWIQFERRVAVEFFNGENRSARFWEISLRIAAKFFWVVRGSDNPTLGSLACKGINKIYT